MTIDPKGQFWSGYAYAGNGVNVISYIDENGEWIHILIGAAIGAVSNYLSYGISTGKWLSKDAFLTAGVGLFSGATAAATGGAVTLGSGFLGQTFGSLVGGMAGGAVGSFGNYSIAAGNSFNLNDALSATGRGMAFGAATGAVGGMANFGIQYGLSASSFSLGMSGFLEVAGTSVSSFGINAGIQYWQKGEIDWAQATLAAGISGTVTAARVWQMGAVQSKQSQLRHLNGKQINKANELLAKELREDNYDIQKAKMPIIRVGTRSNAILDGAEGITYTESEYRNGIYMSRPNYSTYVHEAYHWITGGPDYGGDGWIGAYPFENAVVNARY